MPFKSKKQKDYLRINKPKIYKKWKNDYKDGGVNINIPGGNVNMTEKDVTATMQSGPTWAEMNVPYNKSKDASALLEQEIYVGKNKTVYLNAQVTEGSGGDRVGITAIGENWNVNANTDGNNADISGNIVKRFNNGGMAGCPMDGAAIKGGTKIKPDRYKHGKRKV